MQSIGWGHITRRLGVALVTAIGATLVASCGQDSVMEPPDPSSNSQPVADAGPDLTVVARETATLDGSGSRDPDGDALTYRWELLAQPAGSGVTLSDPTTMHPTLVADVHGDFMAELVVSDGTLESVPDTVSIHADPIAGVSTSSVTVGAGLQVDASAILGVTDHGGVTVRIASDDPLLALVSPDANTPGSAFIDVEVATGDDAVPYVVQGVAGATGTVTITASIPGFSDGAGMLTVVEPAVSIADLHDSQVIGSDIVFSVVVGIPDSAGTVLGEPQGVSAANAPPLTMTVTSSNGDAGRLLGAGSAGDTIAIELATGVSEHEFTFEPLAAGATVVAASVPGFVTLASGSIDVTVDERGLTPFSHTIGAGLQYGDGAQLSEGDHGGVTVRIESSDTTVALIAPDVDVRGSAVLDIVVADGEDVASYVVQGVAGATGTTTVTASAPGFADGTGTITVVEPALAIQELAAGQTAGDEDAFRVMLGIPDAAGSALDEAQAMSAAAASPLTLTVTSSDAAVGEVSAGGITGATIALDITAGMDRADVTFSSLSTGATTVSASIPGFLSTVAATVDVVVGGTSITLFSGDVGAGLQRVYGAILDTGQHGGVTVRIESSDPTLALIAPDGNTPGSAFVDVDVADGDSFAPYAVQGVAGAMGTVTVTASAPGFVDGVGTIEVVQPALSVSGLSDYASIGSPQNFRVLIGVPDDSGEVTEFVQDLSAANVPPLELTVTSSDGDVGELETASTPSTIVMDVTPGMLQPTFTFVPLAEGTTTVSASIPGFLTTTASVDVVVAVEGRITPFSGEIGSGLQSSRFHFDGARLSTSNHDGVTVRIESSDPTIALITDDPDIPGSEFVDVELAAGETLASYWVQGAEGATGTVMVTASAPGFNTGVGTIDVVQPAIEITSLTDTTWVGDDADFTVRIGVPRSSVGVSLLDVSAAAVAPLELTLTSSDAAVGHVTDGVSSGGTITIELNAGASGSTTATFEALGLGTTTVTASIPGFLSMPNASEDVTVIPPAVTSSTRYVGAGLETFVDVSVTGTADHGGVTVRVESGDSTLALIAPDGVTPGSPSRDFELANGVTRVRYYLQGVTGNTGSVSITSSASGYTSDVDTIEVVEPALSISGLSSSVVNPNDDAFQVDFGLPCSFGAESTVCTYQAVSPAQTTPLVLTLTSSDGAVGHVTDGVSSGPTIAVDLYPTYGVSVTFRPVTPGTTTVTASVPGFITTTAGTVDVTVTNQQ